MFCVQLAPPLPSEWLSKLLIYMCLSYPVSKMGVQSSLAHFTEAKSKLLVVIGLAAAEPSPTAHQFGCFWVLSIPEKVHVPNP